MSRQRLLLFGKSLWSDFLIDFLYFNNQTALRFSKAVLFCLLTGEKKCV